MQFRHGRGAVPLPDSFVLSENIEARIAGAALLALFVLTALLKSSGRRRACFASAVYRPPSLALKRAERVKTGRQATDMFR